MIFNLYKHNRDSRDLISWLTATIFLVELTSLLHFLATFVIFEMFLVTFPLHYYNGNFE